MSRILFKKNVRTQYHQYWFVIVQDNMYKIVYGNCLYDRSSSESVFPEPNIDNYAWVEVKGKNQGRSNATTDEEQCRKEVDSLYRHKLEIDLYHDYGNSPNEFIEPMLAYKYDRRNLPETVYVQAKVDGMRCLVVNSECYTRNGKHIPQFSKVFSNTSDIVLDGELYSEELTFQQIISVTRSTVNFKDISKIKLYAFDCYVPSEPDMPFSERFDLLRTYRKNGSITCKLLRTIPINNPTPNTIEKTMQKYVEDGFEGIIIRLDAPYVHGRSTNLFKLKPIESAEFLVLDILPGKGSSSNLAAKAVVQLPNGNTCQVGVTGSTSIREEYLAYKDDYIGLMATVEYQELTDSGSIRFGKLIAFRTYE